MRPQHSIANARAAAAYAITEYGVTGWPFWSVTRSRDIGVDAAVALLENAGTPLKTINTTFQSRFMLTTVMP